MRLTPPTLHLRKESYPSLSGLVRRSAELSILIFHKRKCLLFLLARIGRPSEVLHNSQDLCCCCVFRHLLKPFLHQTLLGLLEHVSQLEALSSIPRQDVDTAASKGGAVVEGFIKVVTDSVAPCIEDSIHCFSMQAVLDLLEPFARVKNLAPLLPNFLIYVTLLGAFVGLSAKGTQDPVDLAAKFLLLFGDISQPRHTGHFLHCGGKVCSRLFWRPINVGLWCRPSCLSLFRLPCQLNANGFVIFSARRKIKVFKGAWQSAWHSPVRWDGNVVDAVLVIPVRCCPGRHWSLMDWPCRRQAHLETV